MKKTAYIVNNRGEYYTIRFADKYGDMRTFNSVLAAAASIDHTEYEKIEQIEAREYIDRSDIRGCVGAPRQI